MRGFLIFIWPKPVASTTFILQPDLSWGLADYAHEQANALAAAGVEVVMLATAQRPPRAVCRYQIRPVLSDASKRHVFRLGRNISWATTLFANYGTLRREIKAGRFDTVLLGAYSEYLAPFWAGHFRALQSANVKFGSIVHDPIRDYMVGPTWWHRRSVVDAYSFLSEAFVHEKIILDTIRPLPALRTTVIPHGPYPFSKGTEFREQARKKLAIPEAAFAVLSFGHIRDGKNLDLVIRALPTLPDVYLVVAGKEQSPGQKHVGYYQELARTVGVQERCRWIHGHVPENEVGNLFSGTDLILLTYDKNFHSASGVLNTSVNYRKPCLASAGGGNLRSVVERYGLGWFIEPDNASALETGLRTAMRGQLDPQWDLYESENSWQRNAQLVKERMFSS